MNSLSNYLKEIVSDEFQMKRIIKYYDEEVRIENKKNMREFVKSKCKRKGKPKC